MRVLVTCPPMLRMIDEFRPIFADRGAELVAPDVVQTLTEEQLIELLPTFDGWISGDDPATERVLTAGVAGRLRGLVKWGVGVDNVDFEACRKLGLQVAHTPGVFGREVADIAMGYVIGLARETFRIDREIREKKTWPKPSGISLEGKVVALVGFGDIGRATARRLLASDMIVHAYDPGAPETPDLEVTRLAWPERLEEADFIVFTCPLNEATRGMFNADTLNLVKPGVRLVNVGRGPVVVTDALIEGLRDGRIHSAALDVVEVEPLAPDSPLRDFDQCIFGSHNASNTADAVRRVSHKAIDLLFGFLH
ncbi:phosphoglycerate dehydrogenase [Phenylobacterium sp. VNQ135]|uniref:phosphoglycerate dehydrogenase n=1 Tax=Phenylobacterium sp. VNQ135 TaxID=3400922 RepID=UPI003C049922